MENENYEKGKVYILENVSGRGRIHKMIDCVADIINQSRYASSEPEHAVLYFSRELDVDEVKEQLKQKLVVCGNGGIKHLLPSMFVYSAFECIYPEYNRFYVESILKETIRSGIMVDAVILDTCNTLDLNYLFKSLIEANHMFRKTEDFLVELATLYSVPIISSRAVPVTRKNIDEEETWKTYDKNGWR